MPPVPRTVPAPAASARISSVMTGTSAISVAAGCRRGSAVYKPSLIGQQNQQVRVDQIRDQRRQVVVVANLDFFGRHDVVLVDDRHHLPLEQRQQRVARVEVPLTVGQIAAGQQRLRDDQCSFEKSSSHICISLAWPTAASTCLNGISLRRFANLEAPAARRRWRPTTTEGHLCPSRTRRAIWRATADIAGGRDGLRRRSACWCRP